MTPTTNFNTLNDWYKTAFDLSSPMNPWKKIHRDIVDFIRNTLLEHFGERYFNTKFKRDKSIDKLSWLFSLLANKKDVGCYYALQEVCLLLQYAKTLEPSVQKELKDLKKDARNLRDFFFELFIISVSLKP